MPTAAATSSQPGTRQRRAAATNANGDIVATTCPSLMLHGPRKPSSRSIAAVCAAVHIGWPLISCLSWSTDQNSGLEPASACTSASSVHAPTITARPPKVTRRVLSVAVAMPHSHRNGR